jgi:Na+-driven multidrug efflux pump
MQTWWFLSYFSSPLSLVAQAVIPKDLARNNTKRVKKMIYLLLKLGGLIGVGVTLINMLLIIYFPTVFSSNKDIQRIMQFVLKSSSVSLFVICMSTVSDGIFIGCGFISDYLKASVLSTGNNSAEFF